MYSHNSYYREKPKDILVDEKKRNIDVNGNLTGNIINDKPYREEFEKAWENGINHNINKYNPSSPFLVKPSKAMNGVK
ncbi:hypothetical protein ABVQ18_17935 [Snodgrassella alvi]|uniref:hypothetical protein n=1 Tax=Snodgrassella alvi TaxID=1196083 RepID=UPI003512F427